MGAEKARLNSLVNLQDNLKLDDSQQKNAARAKLYMEQYLRKN